MLLHQRAVLRIQDMATSGRCQGMKSVQVRSPFNQCCSKQAPFRLAVGTTDPVGSFEVLVAGSDCLSASYGDVVARQNVFTLHQRC